MNQNSALSFYNLNKEYHSTLPKLPNGITTDYEISDWLLNKSDFSWLELDINIDITAWKEEALLAADYFVPHREEDSYGWNSCCIHGINIESTGAWTRYGFHDESLVPYKWTELSDLTLNIKNFWQQFPYDSYRRIRFMEVKPGGYINPHSDAPGRLPGENNFNALEFGVPVNVAIIHPKECFMSLDGLGCVPFKEGKAFIVNIRNYHSVINFSDTPRIHLIAHGKIDKKINKFVSLIARSYRKQYDQQNNV